MIHANVNISVVCCQHLLLKHETNFASVSIRQISPLIISEHCTKTLTINHMLALDEKSVNRIHPLGTMSVCTKYHTDPFGGDVKTSCHRIIGDSSLETQGDISLKTTNVNLMHQTRSQAITKVSRTDPLEIVNSCSFWNGPKQWTDFSALPSDTSDVAKKV